MEVPPWLGTPMDLGPNLPKVAREAAPPWSGAPTDLGHNSHQVASQVVPPWLGTPADMVPNSYQQADKNLEAVGSTKSEREILADRARSA